MPTLATRTIQGIPVYYRPGSSDERVLKEVIDQRCYRRKNIKVTSPIPAHLSNDTELRYPLPSPREFDVHPGESWLDLGANIGAFALYAALRGADSVECYEPDPECFDILSRNIASFNTHAPANTQRPDSNWTSITANRFAVTHHKTPTLKFFKGSKPEDFYRYTTIPTRTFHRELLNRHASLVFSSKEFNGTVRFWDGVKMDIEGSEFGLIEAGLIPKCNKLVLEYHLSRDKELKNFRRRRDILKQHFKHVTYLKSLDQAYPNDQYPGFYDRLIFCYN